MDHDETWSGKRRSFGEINKMVIFREKHFFLKNGTSYLFQQISTFGKNVLKGISYKGQFMEKDLKAFLSFNKGFRCFRKYTRVMKSYKISPYFFSSTKVIEFSNKDLLNKSLSFSFQ